MKLLERATVSDETEYTDDHFSAIENCFERFMLALTSLGRIRYRGSARYILSSSEMALSERAEEIGHACREICHWLLRLTLFSPLESLPSPGRPGSQILLSAPDTETVQLLDSLFHSLSLFRSALSHFTFTTFVEQ